VENGVLKGTVLEVRDITEEKRIQQALHDQEAAAKHILEQKVKERTAELEKLNYELMQFTSVASHDLKEPLRKISIFSKLLKDKAGQGLEPAADKYIDNIIYSSARMSSLIDDLLAFSRLSQDNLQWEPVNLNALLQQIWLDLEISVNEKDAVMHYSGLSEIAGVPLLLGQLFQNLISNSLKFADTARTPVITINAVKAGSVTRIIYSDNGIGFKNEYAEKIFEVFQRLHTKDQYEGTGIGLAIVKKIVSLHKGEIRAYGEEGRGCRFEMELGVER
jgi:light-regulated signal transduction histidine kinase (bacteriophytochrome)